jgi:hypothetical protein
MMVAVDALKHLDGHAQIAGCGPQIYALLHRQVAAVWCSVCGVTFSIEVSTSASCTTFRNAFFTDSTGSAHRCIQRKVRPSR